MESIHFLLSLFPPSQQFPLKFRFTLSLCKPLGFPPFGLSGLSERKLRAAARAKPQDGEQAVHESIIPFARQCRLALERAPVDAHRCGQVAVIAVTDWTNVGVEVDRMS